MNEHRRTRTESGLAAAGWLGVLAAVALLALICLVAWQFLSPEELSSDLGEPTPRTGTSEKVEVPELGPPVEVVRDDPEEWTRGTIHRNNPGLPRHPSQVPDGTEVFTFRARILDSETRKPVLFSEIFLIPTSHGELEQAMKTWNSEKFRELDGRVTIETLPAGQYNLMVRSMDHMDKEVGVVTIPQRQELSVFLDKGTWIDGTVKDSFGMVLPDLKVFLHIVNIDPPYLPPLRRIVTTDKRGYFAFHKLSPGHYTMTVGPAGDAFDSHPEFYIGLNQHQDRSFLIGRLNTLAVTVTRDDGTPVPRAKVTLEENDKASSRSALTNRNGLATLMFVRKGEYQLNIRSPGYESWKEEFSVFASEGFQQLQRTISPVQR